MSESIIASSVNLGKLVETLKYAQVNSPFYKNSLGSYSFTDDFDYANFEKIPFTTKDDLSKQNEQFLAVNMREVAEFVTTSGTSGDAVTIFLTKDDLLRLEENERDALKLAGIQEHDIVQLMTTIDKQFMAGLAYYLGVQAIGAGMIRIGPGVPTLQWKSILQNKPTVLIAVPSFIISLIDFAKTNDIDFKNSSVKKIICIGESIRETDFTYNILGKRITTDWNVELYSTYASTEMAAAFTECTAQNGGHLNSNLLHLEVIKENGDTARNGEVGEIIVTTLGSKGTPLIRYKTGDLAAVYYAECACGKNTPRLGPIVGRKNQMIKFKGTTLFPKSIYEIFDAHAAITCYKIEVSADYLGNDSITVLLEKRVEHSDILPQIVDECRSKLRVVPHFVFLETDYLRSQVFKKNSRKPEKIVFRR